MKQWADRPFEIATLLNPAFCGWLILISLNEYTKNIKEGAPFAYPFIVLPLVLHDPTREKLNYLTNRTFPDWIANDEIAGIVKIGFADRARKTVPYVKEALIFAMQRNSIHITDSGLLQSTYAAPKSFPHATSDTEDCADAASLCGKKLSKFRQFETVLTLLGVVP